MPRRQPATFSRSRELRGPLSPPEAFPLFLASSASRCHCPSAAFLLPLRVCPSVSTYPCPCHPRFPAVPVDAFSRTFRARTRERTRRLAAEFAGAPHVVVHPAPQSRLLRASCVRACARSKPRGPRFGVEGHARGSSGIRGRIRGPSCSPR